MQKQEQSSSDIDIPETNAMMESITQAKDSQPTKKKVTAFKARVFKLLKIYTQKSPTIDPLLSVITQESFMKDPSRLNDLVASILAKQSLQENQLLTLLNTYKALLLFKTHSRENQQKFADMFARILKKAIHNGGDEIVGEMFEYFYLKRNCKLNAQFFTFLMRRIPAIKPVLLLKCEELSRQNIRPAQKKQIAKMQSKLKKRNKQEENLGEVKKEQIEDDIEESQ